jgi:alpha-glucosidase
MLELYRAALRLRRSTPALGDGELTWQDQPAGVLGFSREPGFACVVNVTGDPVSLPDGYDVLLASGPLADGRLPAATSVWLHAPQG